MVSEDKMVQATSEPGQSSVRSPFQFGTWYPIESAPKDGDEVIVAETGYWTSCATWGSTKYHGDGWLDAEALSHSDSYTARPLFGVTHWMPLPPPPGELERWNRRTPTTKD